MSNVSRVHPDAIEMAGSLLAKMEAEGRLMSACDLLRHAVWGPEFGLGFGTRTTTDS